MDIWALKAIEDEATRRAHMEMLKALHGQGDRIVLMGLTPTQIRRLARFFKRQTGRDPDTITEDD